MKELHIFTDGSVNTQTKFGVGAYLVIEKPFSPFHAYKNQVKLISFENTSSTKLELETMIWTLKELKIDSNKINVYTDSQNIINLPERRQKLEQNNYQTSKNKLHANHKIYKEFFAITDKLDIEFIKVQGHQPKHQKNEIDLLFSLVDKASRKALKNNQ